VRIAGNVISPKVLGSIEYGCAVAGAKLVVVLGHTRCGAVTSAVSQVASPAPACAPSDLDCRHVQSILDDIVESIDPKECHQAMKGPKEEQSNYVDQVAAKNVERSVQEILNQSPTVRHLTKLGKVAVVGGLYDVCTGMITFNGEISVGIAASVVDEPISVT
jgi:carbonic anhydrase/SulP family sulfate permease